MSERKALWMAAEIIGGIILWAADPEPFRELVPYLLLALIAIFTYQALSTEKLREYFGDITSKFSSREEKLMHFAVGLLGFAIFGGYWSGIQKITHLRRAGNTSPIPSAAQIADEVAKRLPGPKPETPNKEPEKNEARPAEVEKRKPTQPNTSKAEDVVKKEPFKPQVPPFFGNLKDRCLALSSELSELADDRKQRFRKIMEETSTQIDRDERIRTWSESTSGIFRRFYLERTLQIQKELADLHIRDEHVDRTLAGVQDKMKFEQLAPQVPQAKEVINYHEIEEIAKGLRGMADKVP